MSNSYGPALPPSLSGTEEPNNHDTEESRRMLGPSLPPGFSQESSDSDSDSSDSSSSDDDQQLAKSKSNREKLTVDQARTLEASAGNSATFIGPVIPGNPASEQDDEDISSIGPQLNMAIKEGSGYSSIEAEFEQRAKKMKDKLLNISDTSEVTQRDTWMTQLPDQVVNAFAGMPTARKLTSGRDLATEEERAEWTDTPADRIRKEKELQEGRGVKRKHEVAAVSERDQLMATQVAKYNSKRTESLLEIHEKKLRKKEKKELKKKAKKDKKKKKKQEKEKHKKKDKKDTKESRRPFDRDQDLQVNRFDAAMKQQLVKRSAELNTKFSHSRAQKFL